MPSEVQISHEKDLTPIPERAEGPPYHQTQRTDHQMHLGSSESRRQAVLSTSDDPAGFQVESDQGTSCEPIQLLDREGDSAVQSASEPCRPAPRAQASGPKVFRRDAITGVTDKMCATVEPRSASAVHHHGEQVYVTSGHGVLLTSPAVDAVRAIRADIKGEAPTREEEQPRRHELSPGDFAFIPAWTEHQVVNEADEGNIVWVLVQSGGERVQVDLKGWGGETAQR
ncbi:hypothetical protein LA080_015233 [Diaporthe eres]|nr:hypothetical protein LA080_015233 [Diaporthe eres]